MRQAAADLGAEVHLPYFRVTPSSGKRRDQRRTDEPGTAWQMSDVERADWAAIVSIPPTGAQRHPTDRRPAGRIRDLGRPVQASVVTVHSETSIRSLRQVHSAVGGRPAVITVVSNNTNVASGLLRYPTSPDPRPGAEIDAARDAAQPVRQWSMATTARVRAVVTTSSMGTISFGPWARPASPGP